MWLSVWENKLWWVKEYWRNTKWHKTELKNTEGVAWIQLKCWSEHFVSQADTWNHNEITNCMDSCLSEAMHQLSSCYFPSLSLDVIQSRAACTPPRRKPLESDFETIKLISNGAYGWVRQTSLFAYDWLSLFVDTAESPIKAEKKLKWGCVVVVFLCLHLEFVWAISFQVWTDVHE